MSPTAHSSSPVPTVPALHALPLTGVLWYTAIASIATGMITNGIFFITAKALGYGDMANLALAVVAYLPYIPGALYAGAITRRLGARSTLNLSIGAMALGAVVLAIVHSGIVWPELQTATGAATAGDSSARAAEAVATTAVPVGRTLAEIAVWLVAPIYNLFNGIQWPIVESYLSAGRHGREMRRATGWFNVTWSSTVCASLWLTGLLLQRVDLLFLLLVALHLVTFAIVRRWPGSPPPHDDASAMLHTGPEYGLLLRSAGRLLIFGYLLMYALNPLLPGVWQRLDVNLDRGALFTSIWQVVRVLPFLTLVLWSGWHGRWGLLAFGGISVVVGFGMILGIRIAPDEVTAQVMTLGLAFPLVIAGLIAFGLGQGTVYGAAIYYRLAVGKAAVDAGGHHEAVIGVGYVSGPAIALVGALAFGSVASGVTIGIGLATVVIAVTGVAPYLSARRQRQRVAAERGEGEPLLP